MVRRGRVGLAQASRFLLAVLALALWNDAAQADTLVIQGSTTFNAELLALHKLEIEAASRHTLKVIPNKSNLGLLALLKGEADLAMISTALVNEAEVVRRTNPGLPVARLQVFPVARTEAALVTHPGNPVRSLSGEDLRRVLQGEVADWRELGGPPLPIRLVAAREGGGVVTSVETAVLGPGRHITAPNQVRVQNGPQVLKVVEQEPGAIGITQAKLVTGRAVQRLQTSLPIEQQLNLVSLGDPSPAMLDVVAACRDVAHAAGLE